MTKKAGNAWQQALCDHLRAAGGPLTTAQLWIMMAGKFGSRGRMPRVTMCARLSELCSDGKIERVAQATYRLLDPPRSQWREEETSP